MNGISTPGSVGNSPPLDFVQENLSAINEAAYNEESPSERMMDEKTHKEENVMRPRQKSVSFEPDRFM